MAFEGGSGVEGEVRVAGRPAGTLQGWTLKPDGQDRYIIRGFLANPNELFLTGNRPVEVRLTMGKRFWRWTGCRLEREGPHVAITAVGPWETL